MAFVVDHRVGHDVVVALQDIAQVFRVQFLRQFGGGHQVAEQHRYLAAFELLFAIGSEGGRRGGRWGGHRGGRWFGPVLGLLLVRSDSGHELSAVAQGKAQFLQIIIREKRQHLQVDIVVGHGPGILAKS